MVLVGPLCIIIASLLTGCDDGRVVPTDSLMPPATASYVQVNRSRTIAIAADVWAVTCAPGGAVAVRRAATELDLSVVRQDGERLMFLRGPRPWRPAFAELSRHAGVLQVDACGWPDGVAPTVANLVVIERRVAAVIKDEAEVSLVLARLGLPEVGRVGERGVLLDSGPDPLSALAASVRLATDPDIDGCNPLIRVPRVAKEP